MYSCTSAHRLIPTCFGCNTTNCIDLRQQFWPMKWQGFPQYGISESIPTVEYRHITEKVLKNSTWRAIVIGRLIREKSNNFPKLMKCDNIRTKLVLFLGSVRTQVAGSSSCYVCYGVLVNSCIELIRVRPNFISKILSFWLQKGQHCCLNQWMAWQTLLYCIVYSRRC